MENFNQQLEERIMRRIYIIYALRRVLSPFMVKIYVSLVLLWQLLAQISLASIIQNAPGLDWGAAQFFFSAFVGTEWGVKLVLILAVLVATWLFKDVISFSLSPLAKSGFRLNQGNYSNHRH